MNLPSHFSGIPYAKGGRSYRGADCVGIVALFLRDWLHLDLQIPATPESKSADLDQLLAPFPYDPDRLPIVGDVLFFRHQSSARICHVAVSMGGRRWLHTCGGYWSRVDDGLTLICRTGLVPVYSVPATHLQTLSTALANRDLGWQFAIMFLLSVALSVASSFLMSKPKLGTFRNDAGRYGFDGLITANNPTLPLPDILGSVGLAGNCIFQSRADKTLATSDQRSQRANKVVVLASGPIDSFDHAGRVPKINGLAYNNTFWHENGLALDPAQTRVEAVDGIIDGSSGRGSISLYPGTHDITVPVDIRASYDRCFPVYGFSGSAYAVFRLIDSTKFNQFNLVASVRGRHLRTFDSSGFITATATAESLTGADGSKTRFKLAHDDILSVSSLTVNSVAQEPLSATRQDGPIYHLNALKGYIEFPTPPAAAATIEITYVYYVRAWTQNPAAHLVYLLTENKRGKGFVSDRINWASAAAFQTYCDEDVDWVSGTQSVTEPRWQSDYAIDYRRPVQEHLRAILDAAYGFLTLSAGLFILKPRRDESPVFQLTGDNILAGSFSSEQVDRSTRGNRVRIYYQLDDQYNAESDVAVDDSADQDDRETRWGNEGVQEEVLHCPAVARETHAQRLAQTMLAENLGSQWVVECKLGFGGLSLEPGDVVGVTHPSQPTWSEKQFRIEEANLDDNGRLELKLSEYVPSAYL